MNDAPDRSLAERVLMLAPATSEEEQTQAGLLKAGIACQTCPDLGALCRMFDEGAGAILLTEDSLTAADAHSLWEALRRQPDWSDVPILLLTRPDRESPLAPGTLDQLGNVTVLEWPIRPTTLVSILRTALRARRRQYEHRDRLEERRVIEERFRLAAEAVKGIIYEYDLATGTVTRTRGLYEVLGYRPDEVPTTADWWFAQIHPEDQHLRGRLDDVAAPDRLTGNYRVRHKDGHWLHVEDRALLVKDDTGKVVKMIGCTMDVSERKQAEQALRLQTAKVNRLIQANIVGVVFADREAIQEANDAFLEMVGFTRADLESGVLRWNVLTPPEYALADRWAFDELRKRGACAPYQKEFFRKDGTRVPILIGFAVVDPAAPTWVCFVQDMSRIKEAEQELLDADRKKDEFLATLAHELRNPLAPIRNAVQFLRMRGAREPELQNAQDIIDRQVQQVTQLVDELLDIASISRGKLTIHKQLTSLSLVLTSAVEAARPLIAGQQHTLTVNLPPEPVYLLGDTSRLAQVFLNLLSNAAKFTDRGGHVWLSAERQGSDVAVVVKDDGIGIPADKLANVFDMFARVEGSLSRAQAGLGIGLHLAKRLVDMHGGSVQAFSKGLGEGSEFMVRLPVVVEASQSRDSGEKDEAAEPRSSFRILIVDDNRDSADSLGLMLRLMGNEIRTAYDGQEGVALAEEFRPDVVLLDIGLPKLNGYEACRHLREQPWGKRIIVIAVTGWSQEEDRRRSKEAGFDYHLVKPVDPSALISLLARMQQIRT